MTLCIKKSLTKIYQYGIRFLFPRKCLLCREIIPMDEEGFLCPSCENNLPFITEPTCPVCGTKVRTKGMICLRCRKKTFAFEKAYGVFSYATAEKGIKHFKYDGFKKDGLIFGQLMADYLNIVRPEEIPWIDVITAVPMFEAKRKKRGFNQAEILAEILAKKLGKPYSFDCLKRTRNTAPQSSLVAEERGKNLVDAFCLGDASQIIDKNILLIDDILTVGHTADECSRVLMMGGAASVRVFTLSVVVRELETMEESAECNEDQDSSRESGPELLTDISNK